MVNIIFTDLICQSQISYFFDSTCQPDPILCPNNCGRRYKGEQRKMLLKRHLDNECGVPKKFQCLVCFNKFSQKWNMKSHMLNKHNYIMK